MSNSSHSGELLRLHLATCVPLRIADFQQCGGPTERDRKCLIAEIEALGFGGSFSEGLLYRTKSTAKEAALIVRLVALLAFAPGGVRAVGIHFCATHHPGGIEQDSQCCGRCADAPVSTCKGAAP